MKREGEIVLLEKADLVRMNQLVRRHTDYGRFCDWYQSLSTDEQAALVGELCHSAYQAGVDESIYQFATRSAGMAHEEAFVSLMKKVRGPGGLNIGGLVEWLRSVGAEDRIRAFKLFVHLFGEAERHLIASEDRRSCNHWWHRNLEDQRVVQSILSDPEYYNTSPRDDERLPDD